MRPWSTVTRVLTNTEGTRVTGVEYYDQKKERQVQPASVVVVAAWAAQNPRILLNSATDKHPKGLAESMHRWLGLPPETAHFPQARS